MAPPGKSSRTPRSSWKFRQTPWNGIDNLFHNVYSIKGLFPLTEKRAESAALQAKGAYPKYCIIEPSRASPIRRLALTGDSNAPPPPSRRRATIASQCAGGFSQSNAPFRNGIIPPGKAAMPIHLCRASGAAPARSPQIRGLRTALRIACALLFAVAGHARGEGKNPANATELAPDGVAVQGIIDPSEDQGSTWGNNRSQRRRRCTALAPAAQTGRPGNAAPVAMERGQ